MSHYKDAVKALTEQYTQSFERHVLQEICNTPLVQVFWLREPGRSAYLVELVFTPWGITMQGAFTPNDNQPLGVDYYDLRWFVCREQCDSYLLHKWLRAGWSEEHAADHVDSVLENADLPGTENRQGLREEAAADFDIGLFDEDDFRSGWYARLQELGIDGSDAWPGEELTVRAVAALTVIHTKFCQLFHAKYELPPHDPNTTVRGITLIPRSTP